MKSRKPAAIAANILKYAVLLIGAFFTLLPFLWMISSSFKTPAEIIKIPPVLVPAELQWQNYVEAWTAAPFGRYLINTIIITVFTTVGVLVTSVLSAFAFSRLKFPGKDLVFSLFMATLMIPGEMLIITNFLTITKLHWIDTYQAMIVPWVSNVFYIYLLTQFFLQVPDALYLAAKVDKCSDLKFMLRIMVPMNKSAITTIAILNIIGSWNSFLWPLLVTNSQEMRVLSNGLIRFQTEAGTDYELIMAASCILVVPIILVFLFLRKYVLEGVAFNGVKG
ncbi:carbohydrate ABC transporter permease [uncultured Subdoligranulum sp.]|uniref:carbohydrate ABC transporter permease n=1 Tax=uncultured Subdoligranulum sp. TaxID=512298 RepID=UPI0025D675C8|nr:carbohydrate ABC transporter permease [uncultured Subdoligranulum sp.]